LGRAHRLIAAGGNHDAHAALNQLPGKVRQPLASIAAPSIVDRDIAALIVASLAEPAPERGNEGLVCLRCRVVEESDDRQRRLLRARRERPRNRCATQQGHELPAVRHGAVLPFPRPVTRWVTCGTSLPQGHDHVPDRCPWHLETVYFRPE